jgi:hypothetical protein
MRLLPAALLLAACSGQSPLNEVFVEPSVDGEWDDPSVQRRGVFTTIQAAVDAVSVGGLVMVPNGTYEETVLVDRNVTIRGGGAGQTTLLGSMVVTDDAQLTAESMTLSGPGYDSGIAGFKSVNGGDLVLEDVEVVNFERGVEFADDADIINSRFQGNGYGIVGFENLDGYFFIHGNEIVGNAWGGIAITQGDGNIYGNTLVGNAFAATTFFQVGAIALGPHAGVATDLVDNIVVGNFYGISCEGCDVDARTNIVWGNNTDFINDGTRHPSDLNVDPLFAAAGEGDFHVTAESPAVDAGTGISLDVTDADGEARPQGAGWDIGMDEYAISDIQLVITEVLANATRESEHEYVEVYNAGVIAIDLAGLLFTDGDTTDTLQAYDGGTTEVQPGEYAMIIDSGYANTEADVYGIIGNGTLVTTGDATLGNGLTTADYATLLDANGSTIISSMSYPLDPGDGESMERKVIDDGDVAANWRPSACAEGRSPLGSSCFPPSGDVSGLIITEIMANPFIESTGEFVELFNPTALEIDAFGLILSDGDSEDALEGFQGGTTLIRPFSHAVIVDSGFGGEYAFGTHVTLLTPGATLGNGLTNDDPVLLSTSDGTLIDSYPASVAANAGDGNSRERADYDVASDLASNWVDGDATCTGGSTPGRVNAAQGGTCAMVQITEVMSNPLNEDTGEFVEIYNPGPDSVDLIDFRLGDPSSTDVLVGYNGGGTELGPDSYAVIVDFEYNNEYSIPDGVLVVTTGDTTLGNSLAVGDWVQFEYVGTVWTQVLDTYFYPFNAGNGVSVERVDLRIQDSPDNWLASSCAAGSSPGGDNCVAGAAVGFEESDLGIYITEVMSNPLDERTGEYIELYNDGPDPVDMSFFALTDGDAVDSIFPWFLAETPILDVGQFAIILDGDYADQYTLPIDALLLTTDDSAIGSGLATVDPVFLFEPDVRTVVDWVTETFNAGNGNSVNAVSFAGGNVPENWQACLPNPGTFVCVEN